MKKLLPLLFVLGLTLSACGTSQTQSAPPAQTSTPSLVQTATQTPVPPTATVTPLPTIPTFTPTFDASTIVTVTPAEKAECPKENPELVPDFPYCNNIGCSGGPYHEANLNYLNAGGTLDKLEQTKWGLTADLTGDGLRELIFSEWGYSYVYGCKNGRYETLSEIEGTQNTPVIDYVIDLNNNGIPELIYSNHERRYYHSIHIIEWNGNAFIPLLAQSQTAHTGEWHIIDWVGGTIFNYEIFDLDNDGLKEIIATDEIPISPNDLSSGLPWRQKTVTIAWNGKNFVIKDGKYSSPTYRFQAIQDADYFTLKQNYEKASQLYMDVMFNDELDWWSKERKGYESYNTFNSYFEDSIRSLAITLTETPTPYPTLPSVTPDPAEYPRLAAYAYYRIMLIQLMQGQEAEAASTYQTLQETFGNDPYAAPYVEMASAFWESYQSTQKMYDGCAAAIQYAVEHPEILIPLGSDYHGWQSHIYEPADVCPFR